MQSLFKQCKQHRPVYPTITYKNISLLPSIKSKAEACQDLRNT